MHSPVHRLAPQRPATVQPQPHVQYQQVRFSLCWSTQQTPLPRATIMSYPWKCCGGYLVRLVHNACIYLPGGIKHYHSVSNSEYLPNHLLVLLKHSPRGCDTCTRSECFALRCLSFATANAAIDGQFHANILGSPCLSLNFEETKLYPTCHKSESPYI